MNAPFCFVSWLFQILTNAKGTHARMGEFAQILLPTIPVNALGSTWGGTVNTVSAHVSFFYLSFNSFTTSHSFLIAHLQLLQLVYQPSKLIDQRQSVGNFHKEHLSVLQRIVLRPFVENFSEVIQVCSVFAFGSVLYHPLLLLYNSSIEFEHAI